MSISEDGEMAIEEDPPAGVPEWVVTYGDMMSLLLTFFIMLVSLSKLKEDGQMRAMLDSIKESFGAGFGEFGTPGPSTQNTSILDKLYSLGVSSEGGMEKHGRDSEGAAGPNRPVAVMAEGTVVSLGGPVMFGRFDAELSPELKRNLDILVKVVKDTTNRIDVRGHASPEPLPSDSQYRDQLDLSFARAFKVAQYLVDKGIPERDILVSAAGDTEPRKITRDPDAQMINHRVDVYVTDSYLDPTRAPEF